MAGKATGGCQGIAKPGMTNDDMRQCEFVSIRHRRDTLHMPPVLRTLEPHLQETLLISELLEVPTVVACTDLVGILLSSMVSRLSAPLHLQALELPIELPNDRELTIYLVWHEARRNDAAHRWLRALVEKELPRFTDETGTQYPRSRTVPRSVGRCRPRNKSQL